MTPMISGKRKATWLFRQLSQGRSILRIFLIGLLLLLFLGFAGALQSNLSSIGAGQTELAYNYASLRNGASLKPIEETAHYNYNTTADANLQNYFSLDPETGQLTLRDGLRSLSNQTNPLASFPYQILAAPMARSAQGQRGTKLISLYIQILNCEQYLAQYSAATDTDGPTSKALAEADSVLRCMQIPPVIHQTASLSQVKEWIQQKSKELQLLKTQQDAYLSDAETILSKPSPDRPLPVHSPPPYGWDATSPRVPQGETPVWRIFILQDMARPGLEIFPLAEGIHATKPSSVQLPSVALAAEESLGGSVLRILDRIALIILHLRYPVLICFGILLPLVVLVVWQRDVVVRRCLEPYMLLLLAQVFTLLLAEALMGEGLVILVGFIYTLIRLIQLVGLLEMSSAPSNHLRRLFNLRSRPYLRRLLQLELLIWSVNALGLSWHIVGVLRDFPLISPA